MAEAHLKGDLISREKTKIAVSQCHSIEEALTAIESQLTEIPDDYYAGFQAGLAKQLEERQNSL